MQPRSLLAVAITGFVVLAPTSAARSSSAAMPAERAQAIDRFVGQFVELAMFDGTILVEIGSEVVYDKSFGYASYELAVPHDASTRFHIASVSKMLTDVAVARMIQQDRLSLDTPISRYLPGFPSGDAITIRHLLNHTSGIPHTNDQPWGDGSVSLSLEEIVRRLAALPLDFAPGTDSKYSNGGYAVAARVLELASGKTFGETMRATVFDPLGMKDTGHIDDVRVPIAHMASGYEPGRFPGERRHSRFYAVETRPGGGSCYSTVQDMLHFARAIFRGDFITPELRHDVLGYDDGVFLSQGRSPGFVAKLYHDPKADLIVISLSNNYAVPADWGRAIADLATGTTREPPWPFPPPVAMTVSADDSRLGRYRNSFGGGELTISRSPRGAMILADAESDSLTALVPLSDGSFLQPLYFQRCELAPATRVITCRMLSGNERYTSTLTPIAGASDPPQARSAVP